MNKTTHQHSLLHLLVCGPEERRERNIIVFSGTANDTSVSFHDTDDRNECGHTAAAVASFASSDSCFCSSAAASETQHTYEHMGRESRRSEGIVGHTCARTGGPLISCGLSLAHLGLGLVGGAQSLFPLLLSVALTLHLLP